MIDIKNYQEEVSFDDPRTIREFKDMMRKIAQDEINKAKFDKSYPAVVVLVGSGVADIKLYGTGTTITNVKVRPGLTLTVSDKVYVKAINNSLSNIFIDIK